MYQITSYLIGTNAYSRGPLNLWVIWPSTRRVAQASDYHIVLVLIWKHTDHTLAPRHFWAFTPTSSAFDVANIVTTRMNENLSTFGLGLIRAGWPKHLTNHIVLVLIRNHSNHTLAPRHFWAFTPTCSAFDVANIVTTRITRPSQPMGWVLRAGWLLHDHIIGEIEPH